MWMLWVWDPGPPGRARVVERNAPQPSHPVVWVSIFGVFGVLCARWECVPEGVFTVRADFDGSVLKIGSCKVCETVSL